MNYFHWFIIESSTKNIDTPSTINPELNTTAVLDIIISKDIPQKDILSVTVSSTPNSTTGSEIVVGNRNFIVTDKGTQSYGERLRAVYSAIEGNYRMMLNDVQYEDTGDLHVHLIYKKNQDFLMEKSSVRLVVKG